MIYAKFNSTVTNVITNSVTQWDYGRTLRIDGLNLPTAIRIDFCISGEQVTIARIGTTKDNVTDVVIPDSLLEQSQTIVAYVYLNDTTTGKTVRTITIPVVARPMPEEHDTPESKELFAETIEVVNEIATRVEEAESSTESYKNSVQEMLESTLGIAESFDETASKAVENVNKAGASQIESITNTKNESVEAVKAESAKQLEQIQTAGENIVDSVAISEKNVKNVLASAIKGSAKGEIVKVDDVSPVEHEMYVNVYGKNRLSILNPCTNQSTYRNWLVNPDGKTFTLSITDKDDSIDISGLYIGFYGTDGSKWLVSKGNTVGHSCTVNKQEYVSVYPATDEAVVALNNRFNIQLEEGDTVTEYTPYIDPTTVTVTVGDKTYTPSTDGTVPNIMSTSPSMTISTDTEGVVIDCEYIVDTKTYIDRKFAELQK